MIDMPIFRFGPLSEDRIVQELIRLEAHLEEIRRNASSLAGPDNSTDNSVPTYDGITGKLLQDKAVILIDDSGNVSVTGTIDGRDLATDGTKLDGIETSADVTDATNVNAAGAMMNSDSAGGDLVGLVTAPVIKALRFYPAMNWAASGGTSPVLTRVLGDLDFWLYADTGTSDRLSLTLQIPDGWAGRSLSAIEASWSTNGTSTTDMILQVVVHNYVAGTDLSTGSGTSIFNSSKTITPTGTANAITRTAYSTSGSFTAGADFLRIQILRRSDQGGDTNTDNLQWLGLRLTVS